MINIIINNNIENLLENNRSIEYLNEILSKDRSILDKIEKKEKLYLNVLFYYHKFLLYFLDDKIILEDLLNNKINPIYSYNKQKFNILYRDINIFKDLTLFNNIDKNLFLIRFYNKNKENCVLFLMDYNKFLNYNDSEKFDFLNKIRNLQLKYIPQYDLEMKKFYFYNLHKITYNYFNFIKNYDYLKKLKQNKIQYIINNLLIIKQSIFNYREILQNLSRYSTDSLSFSDDNFNKIESLESSIILSENQYNEGSNLIKIYDWTKKIIKDINKLNEKIEILINKFEYIKKNGKNHIIKDIILRYNLY